jgi:hypothetical protein
MMMLLGLLPVLAFAVWVAAMGRLRLLGSTGAPFRQLLVMVAPLWAGWLVLGTELLSLFSAINRPLLILWWLIPIAAAFYILRRAPRTLIVPKPIEPWKFLDFLFLAILLLLITACGLQAFFSPPMNFDSLTYHLPRIVFWAQHHNVADYSTKNNRQIMMSPYAEFIGLHLMVLTSSDALINQIQWCAFVLTLVGVSLIARQLGAKRTGQILAALITATIPIMFLEASNTKNDVVEAMWAVLAVYWALTFLDRARGIVPRMALLGLTIGAAVLTKGTGVFFAGPTALLAAIALFRHERMKSLAPLALMALLALAMNAGHFTRNYRQFGKLVGPDTAAEGGYNLVNARKTPPAVLSNILRELAIEIGTPWPTLNARMDAAINRLHQLLGIDPHDPGLTFSASPYTGILYQPHDEDRAGAPAHMLLALISLPLAFLLFRRIRFGRVLLVSAIAVVAFIIFCAMLRWQEWNTRLILPVICLLAPAIATVWTAPRIRSLSPLMLLALLCAFYPTLAANDRPLWGPGNVFSTPRVDMRFHWMQYDIPAFQQVAKLIASAHPKVVAFATGDGSPDYIMMHLILDGVKPAPKFEYINTRVPVEGSLTLPPDLIIGKPDFNMLIDPVTKRSFITVKQNQWFAIMAPGQAAAARSLPFYGFDIVSGLNPLEGPYPQWELPAVHWGTFPETRLLIRSKVAGNADLYMEVRRNDNEHQSFTVTLNGTLVGEHAFTGNFRFEPVHMTLPLRIGKNQLSITYAHNDQGGSPPNRGALFRVLQVSEAAATQPAVH